MTIPDLNKRNEALKLWEACLAADTEKLDAEENDDIDDAAFEALGKKAETAAKAYDDHPTPALMESYDGDSVLRCALSGAPLYDTDELLEDTHTDQYFLRSALGLPPRPKEEISADEEMVLELTEAEA
jgi:hypothetical protein